VRGPKFAAQDAWSSAMAAGLILFVGLTAYVASEPWLFPSLGPTAYLLASYPDLPASRPYNCLVGHFVGIASGFAALAVFNAWDSPIVPLNDVSLPRLGAATLAIGLTVLVNHLLRSGHPPAAATTLLVALGTLQKAWSPGMIAVGVILLVVAGELLKRLRRRWENERVAGGNA
jgi:CBS-domain-containing membrane protein